MRNRCDNNHIQVNHHARVYASAYKIAEKCNHKWPRACRFVCQYLKEAADFFFIIVVIVHVYYI